MSTTGELEGSQSSSDEQTAFHLLYDVLDEALENEEGSEHDLIQMLSDMGAEDEAGTGTLVVEDPFAIYNEISTVEFNTDGRTSSLLKSREYTLERFLIEGNKGSMGNPEISHLFNALDKEEYCDFQSFDGSNRNRYVSRMNWDDFEELYERLEDQGYDKRVVSI
jgi:hypothetical protein